MNTLIFDWDGTLADSIDRIVAAMQRAAMEVGVPVRAAVDVRNIIGLALPEAVAVLYPDVEEPALLQRIVDAYIEHYLGLEQQPSALFDGVREALNSLRRQGFYLAVATGKTRRGLDHMLASHGLETYFDVTRCADETAGKPDPLMLKEILQELSVSPADACMIGDSEFDIIMGHNAGVLPVAVTYGAMTQQQLLRQQPGHCVDTVAELHSWALSQYQANQSTGVV